MTIQQLAQKLTHVREQKPLVHNITNVVVTNFTANGLLALGASPVMAYAEQEVADMAKIAGALVLNIGTLTESEVQAMIIAGKSANEHGVPVIFDPVGVGATPYRLEVSKRILQALKITIIRGNAAEIANLTGEDWSIKGVDAGDSTGDVAQLAVKAARQFSIVVVITGEEDIATDGKQIFSIRNGHPILTKVTGSGCLLSSVIGAFAAVNPNKLEAAAAALTYYGVAAECAVKESGDNRPGSFQIELLNQLSLVTSKEIEQLARVEQYQAEGGEKDERL